MEDQEIQQEAEVRDIVDPITGDVLGTVSGSEREDTGMISTSRYEREQVKIHLLTGRSFPADNLTEEDYQDIVREVLIEKPEMVLDYTLTEELEAAKAALPDEIAAAEIARQEST